MPKIRLVLTAKSQMLKQRLPRELNPIELKCMNYEGVEGNNIQLSSIIPATTQKFMSEKQKLINTKET
jgi:hypothetical protein